jgi:lactate dehydrogenase-like 2-hydroxyacid dehydrogenase
MPRLKFWQQPLVGYDNIDLAACSARGVRVANLAG